MSRLALLVLWPIVMQLLPARQAPPDVTAEIRIFESANAHNAFPDDCDLRLQRLYVAEDSELSLHVQFSRELSDEESQAIQWAIWEGDTQLASGALAGQSNPALITTMPSTDPGREAHDQLVHVTYQGMDLASPAPLRVISNAEYDDAYAALSAFTDRDASSPNRLPLSSDLLARFLGLESVDAGVPSVGTAQLDVCDPRLTHRAGANWGPDSVTDVPLVAYGPDQPAADVVAQGVSVALLSAYADEIRQYFSSNPRQQSHRFEFTHTGNLTLNYPLDALLALHGVQFDGALSATIDAPTAARAPMRATDVQVSGTVSDLYDFDLDATGAGAFPAIEAAKLEIASVKHTIGKVFLVAFNLDASIPSIETNLAEPR